ncbi:MAG: hypothetical protein GY832_27690 [Chloroflexi bacterium]|nr:hypothetical protein [Chloroflexota bacterium]
MNNKRSVRKKPVWQAGRVIGLGLVLMISLACGSSTLPIPTVTPRPTFTPQPPTPTPVLPEGWGIHHTTESVIQMTFDTAGGLWYTELGGGLYRWDLAQETFAEYPLGPNGEYSVDGPMTLGPDGVFWIGTDEGLLRGDGQDWTLYAPTKGGLPDYPIGSLAVTDGKVWVGTNGGGLARFDGTEWRIYDTAHYELNGDSVNEIFVAPDGAIWFATDGRGVTRLSPDERELQTYTIDRDIRDRVTAIVVDDNGGAWLGTDDGALHALINGQILGTFDAQPGAAIADVVIAPDGDVWASVFGVGLVCMSGEYVTWYREGDPLPGSNVWDIAVAPDHTLWFATEGGIARYVSPKPLASAPRPTPTPRPTVAAGAPSSGQWTTFSNANHVLDLAFDQEQRLWMVGTGGAVRWKADASGYVKYTQDDGLLETRINAVAVAPDGAVWFGSKLGLTRFDGQIWQTFGGDVGLGHADSETYIVHDIVVAPDGALWFATAGGVSRFDGQTWTHYAEADGLPNRWSYALHFAPDGTPWVATGGGVARFDGQSWRAYTEADGLAYDITHDLVIDPQGVVWVSCWSLYGHALSRFDGTTWTTYTSGDGLPRGDLRALAIAPDGALWVGSGEERAGRLDGRTWTYFTVDGIFDPAVNAVAVGTDNTVWLGTNGGGLRRIELAEDGSAARISTHAATDALSSYGTSALAVTPDGAVWASGDKGIARFDGAQWITFTAPSLTDIAVGVDGSVWALTLDDVRRFDGTAWQTYTTADGLPDTLLANIATAPNGDVWVSDYSKELMHFDGVAWETLPADTLPDGAGVKLAVAPDGALWMTLREGIARYADGRWQTYSLDSEIRVITPGPDSALWVGVTGGVYRFYLGQWTLYRVTADPTEGIPNQLVEAIAVDRDGIVWVGTAGGVARFDGDTWARYTQDDGLIRDWVSRIAIAPDGALWFGYSATPGVSRFVPQP